MSRAFLAALLLLWPRNGAPAEPDTSPLRVTDMAVCREVVDRGCESEGHTFDSDVESVAFLTRVEGATGEAFVDHIWSFEGKEIRRYRLPIRNSRYRTWSTKRVKGSPGKWRVDVVDPVGRLLASVDFVVLPPPENP